MEENEIEAQVRKFPRIGNGEEDGEVRTTNRFHSWHHSSRIIRVSRASGGKDRHSKVMTSKGLRDRRVRLSVTTAIQFYDLQDRLGYDQPSKAVEWLIKSASDSIAELPSLNTTFPETPKENRGNEQGFNSESENENDDNNNNHEQNNNDVNNQSQIISLSKSKSACSSTSETSKGSGSGLSLSRSETQVNRVKARERARERTAKEKERDKKKDNNNNESHNVNPISQTASFTELLTGGISNVVAVPTTASPRGCVEPSNMFNKAGRQQWCASTPMDYFLGPSSYRSHHSHNHHHQSSSVSQIQVGHSLHEAMNVSAFNNMSGENHQQSSSSNPNQMQHLSFIPDHLMPAVVSSSSSCASHQHDQASGNNEYNLNFTMSSGIAGYNRGTLQSNSPSLLPQMQRFSPIDGSTVPFFIGAAPSAAVTSMENNNHHLSSVFDGGHLQLYYADGSRHSDRKGKTKN